MGRTSFRWSCAARSVVAIQGVLVAALIIWALVTAAPGVQGDAGSDFLDEKETQVVLIAKQVEVNDAQTCGRLLQLRRLELVQSCSGSGNCSRYSCWPLLGESFQCVDVTKNKYCTSQSGNGSCTQLRADYSKSYIRLPPFAATELSSLPVEISNSICSQRQLDPTFQNISAPTCFNLISGIFKLEQVSVIFSTKFMEENMSDCKNYDPRIRPW
ncbi:unnamed protein product [Sphagnum jensenii]|uniref:Uncharacterized protein n=1 Tax=Sphagnum jensenii TaxID=128206 RepID=A0ABP1A868_9BRYO